MYHKRTMMFHGPEIDLCQIFGEVNSLYKPFAFESGDRFCILPHDIIEAEREDIEYNNPNYYINCIPNKSSFGTLLIIAIGKLNEPHNHWIFNELRDKNEPHIISWKFIKKGKIWYYQCDN